MPYTATTAPDYVKQLPEEQRDKWIEDWNAAYECAASMSAAEQRTQLSTADPTKTLERNAERYAFAVANSIIRSKDRRPTPHRGARLTSRPAVSCVMSSNR